MFLLIPALLLAMEVARMAAIVVTVPRWRAAPTSHPPSSEDAVRFAVHVGTTEITAHSNAGDQHVFPAASEPAGLEQLARWATRVALAHPEQPFVEVSADGDVPLQTLVNTLDALRGEHCHLAAIPAGEPTTEGCHLWRASITAG